MKNFRLIKNGKSGFTLIELMITVAVVGILAAIAVPGVINWLPNYRLKKAANELCSAFQSARLEAVRANGPRAVFFNIGAGTYQLQSDPGPDGNWNTGDEVAARPAIMLADYGDGIGFGWGNATNGADGVWPPGAPVTFGNSTAVFNNRGMLVAPAGVVYIQNNANASYAAWAQTSGSIRTRKWFEASANWD